MKLVYISMLLSTPIYAMQDENYLGELLLAAVRTDDHNELERLLQAGAPVDYKKSDNTTPLMVAVLFDNLNCLQLLIAKKAQVNHANKHGATALMRAARFNYLTCMKELIAAGAQVNHIDNYGRTALLGAIDNGSQQACELLIDAMLWIPTQKQKVGMSTFLGIKSRKRLFQPRLDASLRSKFKEIWRRTVYENNKQDFASSIAYKELIRIKDLHLEWRNFIEVLLNKYNPVQNNSKPQSFCNIQ